MLGVTILMAPILWNGKRVYRWEGLLLILAYLAYMVLLLSNTGGSEQTTLYFSSIA
jgi:hypothetical protein